MPLLLLLVLVLATAPAAQVGAPAGPAAQADTARADTAGAAAVALADSAARALDSVAVADLADTTAADPGESDARGEPVYLLGRRVFRVYGGLGALSAAERARRIGERLDALARDDAFVPDSLRVVDGEALTTLQSDGAIVMTVTDAEAEALGVGRSQVAADYARRIRAEVARVRERSTWRAVVRNAGVAVALLALLGALLWALGRLFRWADARFLALQGRHLTGVQVRGVEVVRGDQVARAGRTALGLSRLALSLLVVYVVLTTILGLFPWTQAWSRLLLGYLLSPVRAFALAVVGGLPEFFAIVVVVVLIRWSIKGTGWLFRQVADGTVAFPGFYPEFAEPTRKIARFLLVLLGVFLAYPYTPIANSPVFQGLTVFFGLLFSLGSSTAIANVVAGTLLTYTRAFQIGDRVRIGETTGDVVEKTFLVTRVRTPKNEVVAIPNSAALQASVVNYSTMAREGPGLIAHTTVTIGYDVPWATTQALLEEAARRTDGVEAEPPPFVLQTGLGDFSVAYELNAYTREANRLPAVLSGLHRNVQDTFAEAGVEILSPVYEAQRDGTALTLPPPAPAAQDAAAPDMAV